MCVKRCLEDAEYDIAEPDQWDSKSTLVKTGQFTPTALTTSGSDRGANWLMEDDCFSKRTLKTSYDSSDVYLMFEGQDDDIEDGDINIRASGKIGLSADEARELAVAVLQAAEELDRLHTVNCHDD